MHKVARRNLTPRPASKKEPVNADALLCRLNPNLPSKFELLLIEPNCLLRDGVARLFKSTRFDVVASCSNFDEIPSLLKHSPDLILIGGDSTAFVTSTLNACHERYPNARRVVLNEWCEQHLMLLLDSGAHACLKSDVTIDLLIILLTLIMMDTSITSRTTTLTASKHSSKSNLYNGHAAELPMSANPGVDQVAQRLSAREIAVLECLVQGAPNKLIARKFQIAEATVKVHIKAILRKVHAANRTQAAIWAMSHLELT